MMYDDVVVTIRRSFADVVFPFTHTGNHHVPSNEVGLGDKGGVSKPTRRNRNGFGGTERVSEMGH